MLWSIFITYIITDHGLGGFSGLINGLIAAAIGALSMLMSEPTAESYVKRTCMFVLSIATFTFTFTFTKLECYGRVIPLGCQTTSRQQKQDYSFLRENSSVMRTFTEYREFMENLIQKGYGRKMTEEEAVRRSQRAWYLLHYGVFHPQKQGKIRVVFDATSLHDGVSLNNQFVQGPDLTNNLLGILLRFREYRIALVADIEGMFNQVKVPPEDSDALRFL